MELRCACMHGVVSLGLNLSRYTMFRPKRMVWSRPAHDFRSSASSETFCTNLINSDTEAKDLGSSIASKRGRTHALRPTEKQNVRSSIRHLLHLCLF